MNSKSQSRYFIDCAYDGSKYNGWQIQPNGIGVQQVIEEALQTIFREPCPITGSGRTDTGVHARQQIAHVDLTIPSGMTLETCAYKLNSILPPDISIQSIRPVKKTAHARFDAIRRTYKYYIRFRKDPFERQYHYFFKGLLDLSAMQKAAGFIKLHEDFSSFCKSHAASKTPFCKIEHSEISVFEDGIIYTIAADRFLRNMVRAITGTLIEIGKGMIKAEEINRIIQEKDRKSAGFSAPAHGLFLYSVAYLPEIYEVRKHHTP